MARQRGGDSFKSTQSITQNKLRLISYWHDQHLPPPPKKQNKNQNNILHMLREVQVSVPKSSLHQCVTHS